MVKVTFKNPEKLICFDTDTLVLTKQWFGFKTKNIAYGVLLLFTEDSAQTQYVCMSNVKSIEHVKPSEL